MIKCVCCVMCHSVMHQPVGCAHISDLAEIFYYIVSVENLANFIRMRLYVEFGSFRSTLESTQNVIFLCLTKQNEFHSKNRG